MIKTSLNPLMYGSKMKDILITDAGITKIQMRPGLYAFTMCGGGGAGGTMPHASADANNGGSGGCGANGDIVSEIINIPSTMIITVSVGSGGALYGMINGNGGGSDDSPAAEGNYTKNTIGGFGGGGGLPTYIEVAGKYYYANGGGGGGGGGASPKGGRYRLAGSGGGGGGYFRFNPNAHQIESVPGQIGSKGGGQYWRDGTPGVNGNTTDFPTLTSGAGADGTYYKHTGGKGGAGAIGGGASGGGGGAGGGNHSSAWGGAGGGGAGGSPGAGGGEGGDGRDIAESGANQRSSQWPTINYLGEMVLEGWGIGGHGETIFGPATNGADGWVYITRVAATAKEDYRYITEAVDDSRDYGYITDRVTDEIDYGFIKE